MFLFYLFSEELQPVYHKDKDVEKFITACVDIKMSKCI